MKKLDLVLGLFIGGMLMFNHNLTPLCLTLAGAGYILRTLRVYNLETQMEKTK